MEQTSEKRTYLLFAGSDFYPNAGFMDFKEQFYGTLSEAKTRAFFLQWKGNLDWNQVVDKETLEFDQDGSPYETSY